MSDEDRCLPEEVRGYDPDTKEWVYGVACLNPEHADRDCPVEHEMFRWVPKETERG